MSTKKIAALSNTKTQAAAAAAKKAGYRFVASVVKQVFNTTYYRVLPIDQVIQNGWTGDPSGMQRFVIDRRGVRSDQLPIRTILRTAMMSEFGQGE